MCANDKGLSRELTERYVGKKPALAAATLQRITRGRETSETWFNGGLWAISQKRDWKYHDPVEKRMHASSGLVPQFLRCGAISQ